MSLIRIGIMAGAARRRAVGGFDPLTLSPALWLDASDSSTLFDATTGGSLVAADGTVARWEDKSGNARHATQATSGSRPQRKTSAQNGKDALRFDGSDDFLSLTGSALDVVRNISALSCFIVYKLNNNPTNNTIALYFSTSNASSARLQLGVVSASQKYRIAGRRLDSNTFQSAESSVGLLESLAIQSGIYDYSSANIKQYINGILDGQNNSFQSSGLTQDTSSVSARIGSGQGVNFVDSDISELLIFPTALSNTDRQAVESYLADKWGITLA